MFEGNKLTKAILANDHDAIRALVDKKGVALLSSRLPISLSRENNPGDEWLKRAFKRPTALTLAMIAARKDTVDLLVELGASPLQKLDHNYPNQLFVAAAFNRADVLHDWLPLYREAARVQNIDNDTLLHIACQHKNPRVTRLLLANGFYTTARSDSGNSPLLYAEKAADKESISLLHAAANGQLPAAAQKNENILQLPAHVDMQPIVPATTPLQLTDNLRDGWQTIDEYRIARVTDVPAIGYRLTEVFNFESNEVLRLNRNLETGAESATVTSFDAIAGSSGLVRAAHLLGVALDDSLLVAPRAKLLIEKPK